MGAQSKVDRLAEVIGPVERVWLYKKPRIVVPWFSPRHGLMEVWLDPAKMETLVERAIKNAGGSAWDGPVSVRRADRHHGAVGSRRGSRSPGHTNRLYGVR